MKLLFINQSLGIGGAETFNKELLVWLQSEGLSIKTYVTNKIFQDRLKESKIDSRHIPIIVDLIGNWKGFLKGIFLFPFAFLYYTYLVTLNRNTDIILMSGFIEKILVTPIAKLFNIKVVWVEFAPLNSVFNKFWGFNKFIYKLVINLPSKIIVPTKNTLQKLSKETGLPNNKFTLIPCAREIDINNYSNIKTKKNLVCCVSRLEKGKGQDLLLRAWQKVEKEIPSAKLNIIGEGGFLNELKQIVIELKLNNVEFTGFVKDPLEEIALSEIFVFPTIWELEGFGLAAVEAMALKKPVVCFDFGPIPEIVDSTTGVLVKTNNINELANTIIKLLNSPQLGKIMGEGGRKKYLNNFTFKNIGKKYLKLINHA